jgi:hypothetical protein
MEVLFYSRTVCATVMHDLRLSPPGSSSVGGAGWPTPPSSPTTPPPGGHRPGGSHLSTPEGLSSRASTAGAPPQQRFHSPSLRSAPPPQPGAALHAGPSLEEMRALLEMGERSAPPKLPSTAGLPMPRIELPSTAGLPMPKDYAGGQPSLGRSSSAPIQTPSARSNTAMAPPQLRRTQSASTHKHTADAVRGAMKNASRESMIAMLKQAGAKGPFPTDPVLKGGMSQFIQMTQKHNVHPQDVLSNDPGLFVQMLTGQKVQATQAAPPPQQGSPAARQWLANMGGESGFNYGTKWNQSMLEGLSSALKQEGRDVPSVKSSGEFSANWETLWKSANSFAQEHNTTPFKAFEQFVTNSPDLFLNAMNKSGGGSGSSVKPDAPQKAKPTRTPQRRQAVAG